MLKKILKLFKHTPKYKDFPINFQTLKKKPLCYGDLFKELGMVNLIEELTIGGKYHYANIRANKLTVDILDSVLKENLCKTKNKYSKMYRKHALENMSAFDRLMYAPKEDESIPNNIIRVLLPNHKNFTSPID